MQRIEIVRFLILDSGPETYDPGPIFTLRSLRPGVRKIESWAGFFGTNKSTDKFTRKQRTVKPYPKESEEKRLLDDMLLVMPR